MTITAGAGVPIPVAKTIYIAFFRSVVDYLSPAFCQLSKTVLQPLKKFRNQAIRLILGCPPPRGLPTCNENSIFHRPLTEYTPTIPGLLLSVCITFAFLRIIVTTFKLRWIPPRLVLRFVPVAVRWLVLSPQTFKGWALTSLRRMWT